MIVTCALETLDAPDEFRPEFRQESDLHDEPDIRDELPLEVFEPEHNARKENTTHTPKMGMVGATAVMTSRPVKLPARQPFGKRSDSQSSPTMLKTFSHSVKYSGNWTENVSPRTDTIWRNATTTCGMRRTGSKSS